MGGEFKGLLSSDLPISLPHYLIILLYHDSIANPLKNQLPRLEFITLYPIPKSCIERDDNLSHKYKYLSIDFPISL